MSAELKFIGHIRTPYRTIEDCPNNIQSGGPLCHLRLNQEYQDELAGLSEGQSILILYWLGNSDRILAGQRVESDEEGTGTFALRTPLRPNPIGVAVLPIEHIEIGQLTVRGLDCLDNTELLDIKPAIYREAAGH